MVNDATDNREGAIIDAPRFKILRGNVPTHDPDKRGAKTP
jgi:hypothetical protein